MRIVLCVVFLASFIYAAPVKNEGENIQLPKIDEPIIGQTVKSSSIEGKPIINLEQRGEVVPKPVESIITKHEEPVSENISVSGRRSLNEIKQPIILGQVPIENNLFSNTRNNIVSEPIQVGKISETSVDSSSSYIPSASAPVKSEQTSLPKVEEVRLVGNQFVGVPEIVQPVKSTKEMPVPINQPGDSIQKSHDDTIKLEIPIVSESVAKPIEHKIDMSNEILKPQVAHENNVEFSRSLKENEAPVPVESRSVGSEIENVKAKPVPAVNDRQEVAVENVPSNIIPEPQSIITPIVESRPVSSDFKPISVPVIQDSAIVPGPKSAPTQEQQIPPNKIAVVPRVSQEKVIINRPVEAFVPANVQVVPEPNVVASLASGVSRNQGVVAQSVPQQVDIAPSKPEPSVEKQVPVDPIKLD